MQRPTPKKWLWRAVVLAVLVLPVAGLLTQHMALKFSSMQEPQAPVDPERLEAEVQRYLENPRVAAAKGDIPRRMPWDKMGRRKVTSAPFGGKVPKHIPVEVWLEEHPVLRNLWRTFEDDSGDPVGDADFRKVVKVARARTDKDPDDTRAWFLLAMGLKELQQENTALEILQAVTQKEPGLWKAHLELGILLSDMKRFDEGLVALDRAAALDASYEVFLNRGIALCFALRFNPSEWDLWKAVETAPDDGNAYYDLAWVHAQRKEPALTVEMLRYASRDPALFQKRISRETLVGDTFFRPVRETPEFQAYLAIIPSHDLRVERNWPTLSRFAKRRSLLERLLGIVPEANEHP